jgi:hypothetical protein
MSIRRLALVALAPLLLTAPALAGPTWTTGFGQGTLEAGVTGSAGTDLYLSCSAGTATPTASLFFMAPADYAAPVGQAYLVDFVIDDKTMTLVMGLEQPTLLGYDGSDPATFTALEALTRLLRAGKTLTVKSDQLTWTETFPLKGSGKALEGIFEGCEPQQ